MPFDPRSPSYEARLVRADSPPLEVRIERGGGAVGVLRFNSRAGDIHGHSTDEWCDEAMRGYLAVQPRDVRVQEIDRMLSVARKALADEGLVTAAAAARFLGITIARLYDLARQGRIPFDYNGRVWRFSIPELRRWLGGKTAQQRAGDLRRSAYRPKFAVDVVTPGQAMSLKAEGVRAPIVYQPDKL